MNDIKSVLSKAMDSLSADRDVVSSAKIRAEAERPKSKISARRIFCTAAAACAVLIGSITAAAVTGLIDFEAVFGDYIRVEDSELANSLVGTVKNFKYKVSDDDYKIDIKGVTGSDRSVTVIAEISRVDGVPVADCFANPVPSGEKLLECLWTERDIFMTGYGSSWHYYINEADNIELCVELSTDTKKISDKKITVEGENFYPSRAYWDFKNENNVNYIKWDNYNFSGYAQRDENGGITGDNIIPADVDDSGIIALALEWEFSFEYTASGKSEEVKSQTAPEESFILKKTAYNLNDTSDISEFEVVAVPTYIEAGSTGGSINFEYEMTYYENSADYSVSTFEKNEVYIILSSGEHLRGDFSSSSERPKNNIAVCSYSITYLDENGKRIFVNADDITAISINGTVYELN